MLELDGEQRHVYLTIWADGKPRCVTGDLVVVAAPSRGAQASEPGQVERRQHQVSPVSRLKRAWHCVLTSAFTLWRDLWMSAATSAVVAHPGI